MYPIVSINKAQHLREAMITDREKTLERIYAKTFPMVLHYVKTHGGTSDDAKDLLQEAIILFYEKLMQGNLQLTASASTYIMAVCKNLWRSEYRKRSKYSGLPDTANEQLAEETTKDDVQSALNLSSYMEALGQKCKDILVDFYYHNLGMEKIATKHLYRNIHTATVQKFKCLERLRKTVSSFSFNQFLN
jgi:RNA polymerase sigma factor (sigma-70 family)